MKGDPVRSDDETTFNKSSTLVLGQHPCDHQTNERQEWLKVQFGADVLFNTESRIQQLLEGGTHSNMSKRDVACNPFNLKQAPRELERI